MVSRFASKWRWYDWLIVFIFIVILVRVLWPTSGAAIALHNGAVLLGNAIQWFANLIAQLLSLA